MNVFIYIYIHIYTSIYTHIYALKVILDMNFKLLTKIYILKGLIISMDLISITSK